MTPEQAAAVARLRNKWTSTATQVDERGQLRMLYVADLCQVADLYLVEHPPVVTAADDPVPGTPSSATLRQWARECVPPPESLDDEPTREEWMGAAADSAKDVRLAAERAAESVQDWAETTVCIMSSRAEGIAHQAKLILDEITPLLATKDAEISRLRSLVLVQNMLALTAERDRLAKQVERLEHLLAAAADDLAGTHLADAINAALTEHPNAK